MKTATIVGTVDPLGYLRCTACTDRFERDAEALRLDTGELRPVYADAAPHNAEPCDTCRRPLNLECAADGCGRLALAASSCCEIHVWDGVTR